MTLEYTINSEDKFPEEELLPREKNPFGSLQEKWVGIKHNSEDIYGLYRGLTRRGCHVLQPYIGTKTTPFTESNSGEHNFFKKYVLGCLALIDCPSGTIISQVNEGYIQEILSLSPSLIKTKLDRQI